MKQRECKYCTGNWLVIGDTEVTVIYLFMEEQISKQT